jgi:hypothetical protein
MNLYRLAPLPTATPSAPTVLAATVERTLATYGVRARVYARSTAAGVEFLAVAYGYDATWTLPAFALATADVEEMLTGWVRELLEMWG